MAALNAAPTDALHGKAPEDVAGDENVIFDTQKIQAEKAERTQRAGLGFNSLFWLYEKDY